MILYNDWPGVVLVSLQQDVDVCHKGFQAEHHPRHPRAAGLEEPDQLVDIVSRDLLRLLQQEDSFGISSQKSSKRSPVLTLIVNNWRNVFFFYLFFSKLTWTDRELCIAVWPERCPLNQLKKIT